MFSWYIPGHCMHIIFEYIATEFLINRSHLYKSFDMSEHGRHAFLIMPTRFRHWRYWRNSCGWWTRWLLSGQQFRWNSRRWFIQIILAASNWWCGAVVWCVSSIKNGPCSRVGSVTSFHLADTTEIFPADLYGMQICYAWDYLREGHARWGKWALPLYAGNPMPICLLFTLVYGMLSCETKKFEHIHLLDLVDDTFHHLERRHQVWWYTGNVYCTTFAIVPGEVQPAWIKMNCVHSTFLTCYLRYRHNTSIAGGKGRDDLGHVHAIDFLWSGLCISRVVRGQLRWCEFLNVHIM